MELRNVTVGRDFGSEIEVVSGNQAERLGDRESFGFAGFRREGSAGSAAASAAATRRAPRSSDNFRITNDQTITRNSVDRGDEDCGVIAAT